MEQCTECGRTADRSHQPMCTAAPPRYVLFGQRRPREWDDSYDPKAPACSGVLRVIPFYSELGRGRCSACGEQRRALFNALSGNMLAGYHNAPALLNLECLEILPVEAED